MEKIRSRGNAQSLVTSGDDWSTPNSRRELGPCAEPDLPNYSSRSPHSSPQNNEWRGIGTLTGILVPGALTGTSVPGALIQSLLPHFPNQVFIIPRLPNLTTPRMSLDTDVAIVGAGPVGLVIALIIAKQGIKVTVLEKFDQVIQSPRAMIYGPAAVVELERTGIAQECREIGMAEDDYNGQIRWITLDGRVIASVDPPSAGYPPVICGQHKVAEVILKHMASYSNAKALWSHEVVGIDNRADSVTVICNTPNGKKEITAKYVVGADGARSTVRKLIGCTFDGFTYDKMVVATNVYYPFREHGFKWGQFIVHPDHFALVDILFVFSNNDTDCKMCTRWNVPLFIRRRRFSNIRRSARKTRLQVQPNVSGTETSYRKI
jgi:FAD binding domain